MATSLTGQNVNDTYDSLIKVGDNGVVTSALKQVSDGLGNEFPMKISSTQVVITGSLSGSATTAISASYATTASFVQNAVSASYAATASFVQNAISASYAATASVAQQISATALGTDANYRLLFKSGAATIETAHTDAGILYNPNTNRLFVDGVISSSNDVFGYSFQAAGAVGGATFISLGDANILGAVTASIVSASNGFTGSLFGTASWATTASYALNGGVTINNNTDNYIITATGTANTLNGEANLQYSGSTLINKGRSLFVPAGGVLSTSHQFKPTTGDTYNFIISDIDGESAFVIQGDITTNSNQKVIIGDAEDAGTNTKLTIDEASGSVAVTGKFRADSIRMTDVPTGANNNGEFRVGSVMADSWSTTGPSFTAGRVVYLSGSGQWAEAVASSTGSSTGVLGVTTVNVNQNEVLLHGVITVSQSLAGFTNGRPVYLATSSNGTITQTAPTTAGHVARYVGYVIDSGSRQVYFNPDFTYVEL